MQKTIDVQKMGQGILYQLESFNKKMWDAVSLRMIHALISKDPILKCSYQKTQEYRKQRWEKALRQTQGDKRKAYQLLASEKFN